MAGVSAARELCAPDSGRLRAEPLGRRATPTLEAAGARARDRAVARRNESTSGGADAGRVLVVGEPSLDKSPGRAGRGSTAGRRSHCRMLRWRVRGGAATAERVKARRAPETSPGARMKDKR